jgi:aspartate/methionine/tyrosine aminotransferase
MTSYHAEAKELNRLLKAANPNIYTLLSEKGRAIYFPKKGMLKQGADAKGKRINATIGMAIEDDNTPMRLSSIARNVPLEPEHAFPYASSYGIPELRKVWHKLIYEKNPSLKGKCSLSVVVNGITHGLSITGYLFVNPGDEILVSNIQWENYKLIFEHGYQARIRHFNTFKKGVYDLKSLEKELGKSTGRHILLLNFPHNPTGYTITEDEVKTLVEILKTHADKGHKMVVILDDAYFGLIYQNGIFRESLFPKIADLHENILVVKIDGATKEDYVWGFRVGFITYACKQIDAAGYSVLEDKTGGAIRGSISSASHISQSLLLRGIISSTYQEEKKKKYDLLKSRYSKVQEVLQSNKIKYSEFFSPLPFNSGYFMCVQLKKGIDAEKIRQELLNRHSTGVIAIGNLIRIAFSSVAEKDIPALFENLYHVCLNSDK